MWSTLPFTGLVLFCNVCRCPRTSGGHVYLRRCLFCLEVSCTKAHLCPEQAYTVSVNDHRVMRVISDANYFGIHNFIAGLWMRADFIGIDLLFTSFSHFRFHNTFIHHQHQDQTSKYIAILNLVFCLALSGRIFYCWPQSWLCPALCQMPE